MNDNKFRSIHAPSPTAPSSTSLEGLRTRLRANGGPANLNAVEIDRLWLHKRALGLTEAEVQTLTATRSLNGSR